VQDAAEAEKKDAAFREGVKDAASDAGEQSSDNASLQLFVAKKLQGRIRKRKSLVDAEEPLASPPTAADTTASSTDAIDFDIAFLKKEKRRLYNIAYREKKKRLDAEKPLAERAPVFRELSYTTAPERDPRFTNMDDERCYRYFLDNYGKKTVDEINAELDRIRTFPDVDNETMVYRADNYATSTEDRNAYIHSIFMDRSGEIKDFTDRENERSENERRNRENERRIRKNEQRQATEDAARIEREGKMVYIHHINNSILYIYPFQHLLYYFSQ
jgi:hypothetical protein